MLVIFHIAQPFNLGFGSTLSMTVVNGPAAVASKKPELTRPEKLSSDVARVACPPPIDTEPT